jgi:outer membrane lipoprotein-sorting protein
MQRAIAPIGGRAVQALLLLLLAANLPVAAQTPAETVLPDDPAARSILEKADQIRFPQEGFQVDVAILTTSPNQAPEERKFRVLSKGNENTIVQVTEPASERGQIMLMKGRDLWVFMPNISQPVRLSLAQRLTGQVANGDLARANFVGDYAPKLLRTEVVDGEKTNVLELFAVDRGVTYQRVLFWVRAGNNHPVKAEFYTASGRLLKTCLYEKFERMAGKVRPTRLVMEDALRKGEQSALDYSAMKLRDLPDKVFTKDYLKRLE